MINTIALFGEVLADVFPNKTILGGAPYNVARHLRAFKQNPVLVSRTGNDALREQLLAELSNLGMDASSVQCDPVYPTGQVNVRMENGKHTFEILPNQAYDHIHAGLTHLAMLAIRPDLAYFGTLAQRVVESRLALDMFLSDAKSPRFLDLNLRYPWYDRHLIRRSLLRADIVKMNEEELNIICDMFRAPNANDSAKALFLMQKFGFKQLLVTCGEHGAWALTNEGNEARVTGQKIGGELVDTVGAGDGFSAIYILGVLRNWPIQQTLSRAGEFATALCKIRGAAPESQDFYLPFIRDWN